MNRTGRKTISLLLAIFTFIGLTACTNTVIVPGTTVIDENEVISLNLNDNEELKEDLIKKEVVGNLEVHFIDVGQADSILIKNKEYSMLIDAGNNDDSSLIKQYLKDEKISKLNYVIGTHPHEDHIGALDTVINNFDIETIIMPNKITTTKTFDDVITAIENKKLLITEAKVGDKYSLGDAEFIILAPNKDYGDELNNASVVIRLTYGENSFLFTGDAEEESENDILESRLTLKSDVLKFGHHGSSTSTSEKFLEAVSPKYGVIMCETGNSYGHPHIETLRKIEKNKIEVYRTDKQGTIIATSDGKNITWKTNKSNSTVQTTLPTISQSLRPQEDNQATTYILNKNTKKFHYKSCQSASKISEKNKEEFLGTREDLILDGYSACGNCKP